MKIKQTKIRVNFISTILISCWILLSFANQSYAQICNAGVPTFTFDFTGHPDSVFNTGNVTRLGGCCGNNSNCIHFDMLLDPQTAAVTVNVTGGALPTGSFFLQLDCGARSYGFGAPICISGAGHHDITFCKPGSNTNSFSVTAVSRPTFPATDTVRIGCSSTMQVRGLIDSTITWQSVYPGNAGDYNSYLSCTSKCSTAVFTPQPGSPPYIDYQICGTIAAASCAEVPQICQTVRVYVQEAVTVSVNTPDVNLTCLNPTAVLTATAASGTTLLWSPGGQTTSSITVSSAGTYTVTATSNTNGCTASASAFAGVTQDFSTPSIECGPGDILTCSHTSATIGANLVAGVTYAWSGPGIVGYNTGNNISVNSAGTYTVIATKTSSGCTQSCFIVVTQDFSTPNLQCGQGDNLTCTHTSTSVSATANSGVTYLWSGPGIVGSNTGSSITLNTSGTYSVVATQTSSGCTQSCSIMITQDISTPNLSCGQGDNLTCTHTSGTIGASSVSGVTFIWSGPGIIGSNTDNNITINAPGTYSVIATKTSSGCTQSCSIVVTQDLSVSPAHAGPDKVISCAVPQINLSANPIPSGATYIWNAINGGHIVSGGNTASPLVNAAGCYVLTVTKIASGCISRDTACITGNTVKPSCNIISPSTVPDSNSTGNTLTSNSTNANLYHWSVSTLPSNNPWTITSAINGASITYTAGTGVAVFTLIVTNTANGCVDSCTLAVGVNGSKFCMYGQGAYGNAGGVHCNGQTTPVFLATLLNTSLTLGGGSNSITFYQSDVNCLISRLPGGGAFSALNGIATCANPTGIRLFVNGRFRNGLLAQTITYGLNLRICNISNVIIFGPYMVTYGSSGNNNGCCTSSGIAQGTARTTVISVKVWNYLKTQLGHNPTFLDLFNLANDALAGTYVPVSTSDPRLTEIAGAEEAISSAFDECGVLAGFSTIPLRLAMNDQSSNGDVSETIVNVFPNPFSAYTTIQMKADADYNNVVVEVFSITGAKVKTLYNGNLKENNTYRWDLNGKDLAHGVYIYRITADDQLYQGKLILINQ